MPFLGSMCAICPVFAALSLLARLAAVLGAFDVRHRGDVFSMKVLLFEVRRRIAAAGAFRLLLFAFGLVWLARFRTHSARCGGCTTRLLGREPEWHSPPGSRPTAPSTSECGWRRRRRDVGGAVLCRKLLRSRRRLATRPEHDLLIFIFLHRLGSECALCRSALYRIDHHSLGVPHEIFCALHLARGRSELNRHRRLSVGTEARGCARRGDFNLVFLHAPAAASFQRSTARAALAARHLLALLAW